MSSSVYPITSIKPLDSLFAEFKPRSKEGEEEKPRLYVSYSLPESIAALQNEEIGAFCKRAFAYAIEEALKDAVRNGKEQVIVPALSDCFGETKREFLIKRADLESWLDGFAMPLVIAAIASKTGLHVDNGKVKGKAAAYKETMLKLASRQMMAQEEIDNAIRVMSLCCLEAAPEYSENVAKAIERKQAALNKWLEEGASDAGEIDF
jgi:hypothetical protein